MSRTTIFCLCVLLGLTLFHPSIIWSQSLPASSSGQLEDLTESVKKRIQGVIAEQSESNNLKVAFGKLISVNNNTLSIEGDGAVQLASTSAQTQFLRLPGNTKLNLEDLAIDEFLIVVGQDQNPVINTTKVVSQKTAPLPGPETTFFGLIDNYNPETFAISLTDPLTQTNQVFSVGRKTGLYLSMPDGTKQAVNRSQDIPTQSQGLVVYVPDPDTETEIVAQEILILPSSPIITPPELEP